MTTALDLLRDLVRIPSPNPPGDTQAVAAYVAETMRRAGCQVQTPAPDAKPEAVNAIATMGQGAPVIMLHAHIDTVPIAGDEAQKWTVDPYAATVKDGRLYGKGSVDDKAPLAAMMAAVLHAAAHRDRLHGTLVLVAAAEEEVGGQLGTRWMAEAGHLPECDFIVVGEQTHNRVATAHKGVLRATVRTMGRAAHATNPDRGINAISAMARVVLALEAYHRELAGRVHPMVGVPTCNVGVIQGGSTANAVPDTCVVQLDRRMIPGENPVEVQAELARVVQSIDVHPAESVHWRIPRVELVQLDRRVRSGAGVPGLRGARARRQSRPGGLSAGQRRQASGRPDAGRDGHFWPGELRGCPRLRRVCRSG